MPVPSYLTMLDPRIKTGRELERSTVPQPVEYESMPFATEAQHTGR